MLSAPVKALGKEEISKKIKKPSLHSALFLALGKDFFVECHAPALGKVFFCFLPPNFLCSPF